MIAELVERLGAWGRYAEKFAYYLRLAGPRKAANVLLVELERRIGRTELRGKPYYFFIDPCDVCNLRCPLCSTGDGSKKGAGMLRFEDFEALLDKVAPYAVEVALYSWGEPLLNRQVFAMIEAVRRRRIYPVMSSNLNVRIDRLGDRLIDAGLEKLIVSLDGVSQEVYEQYRVRGDVELVYANLRALIEAKRRRGARRPLIEWQYIVFRHNEHELELARSLARELGVDRFRVELPYFPPGTYNLDASPEQVAAERRWFPSSQVFSRMSPANLRRDGFLINETCSNLYRGLFITPRGAVNPCCFATEGHQQFGDLLRDDLAATWNNERYRASRALFARRPAGRAGTLCDDCYLFRRPAGVSQARQNARATAAPITLYDDPPARPKR